MSRNLDEVIRNGSTRDVVLAAIREVPRTFTLAAHTAAKDHLSYATRTTNAHAAHIAGDCGRRCELIARNVELGTPLDLDDIRIRVEAFNLAAMALGLSRTERNAIVNREAVAHINGPAHAVSAGGDSPLSGSNSTGEVE